MTGQPLRSIHASDVQGFCPACGHGVLMLGEGGHVTCTLIDCPNPSAADEVLRHAHLTECEHAAGQRQAEAALERVRALAERLNGELASDTDQAYARAILTALDQPTPGTTATDATDGWTRQDDGTWTLPIDGGTVLMTRQTTSEERARFAEQWAQDTKTKPNGSGVDEPQAAPCADCAAGVHMVNYHRRHLPPPRIVPAEHCGHLPPQASFTTPPTECVLRPGHQGSHADDRGCRWWQTPMASVRRQDEQNTPGFTGDELKVLRLCISAALSQHVLVHRQDQAPDCCADAVLAVLTPKEERQ